MMYKRTFEDFNKCVKAEVEMNSPGEEILVKQIVKANETYYGMIIKRDDVIPCAVVNLNRIYDDYYEGKFEDWDEMIDAVVATLNATPDENIMDIARKTVDEYDADIVFPRLSMADFDTEFHDVFKGMKLTYHIMIGDGYTTRITEGMVKNWGITKEKVKEDALRNLEVNDILNLNILQLEERVKAVVSMDGPFGASALLCDALLKFLYNDYNGKYIIIPTSVHEFMTVEYNEDSIETLKWMLLDGNKTLVEANEILSYNIMVYDGNELRLVS